MDTKISNIIGEEIKDSFNSTEFWGGDIIHTIVDFRGRGFAVIAKAHLADQEISVGKVRP